MIVEKIATRKPEIDKSTSFRPFHFENIFFDIPIRYKTHTAIVPMSLGSAYEKLGKAIGSQIMPIIIAIVIPMNPITADIFIKNQVQKPIHC